MLSRLSVGKHPTKLYFQGQSTSSSAFGGILTLISAILLLIYSIYILSRTFSRADYTLERSSFNLDSGSITLKDFRDTLLQPVLVMRNTFDVMQECSDYQMKVVYRDDFKVNKTLGTYPLSKVAGDSDEFVFCVFNASERPELQKDMKLYWD